MTMDRTLKLYNSISKTSEVFIPRRDNEVKMYICGPTVYDSPHIGHARTYVMFDVIRRVLSDYLRYNVNFVMNITDIDDKIIVRANETGVSMDEVTRKYTEEFFEDMKALNVRPPSFVTFVTSYVDKIIKFIEKLEVNGFAYESEGSVYFNLNKYQDKHGYPLFKNKDGINTEGDENKDKRNPCDFVLWKKSKENEPRYESKWGYGRPGWHIECSVMSSDILGEDLDIHAGGIDLAFPHHENEIAQCQAYFMKEPWVKCFLHTGHLNIDGLKMSKSLKNFTTIKEALEVISPRQLRILFLHHQWNKDMNYEREHLKFAESIEKKIFNFMSVAESMRKNTLEFKTLEDADREVLGELKNVQKVIHNSILDNIDTPTVMKKIVEMINFTNSRMKDISSSTVLVVKDYIKEIMEVFGLNEVEAQTSSKEDSIAQLLGDFRENIRRMARQKEPYSSFLKKCDWIRESIKDHGYIIEDNNEGSILRKK
ncbi:cysteinyl-tRNA synthetase [Encephalitozoon intestinalis ATCC 50506]|uniref:cysteine--tRNA ligase n=1 Tax=Encephalitozoon intestinalis (strain ATCC 50506) TaxID=876142 RepID=E0S8I3_ENCIT|nr:cysteinyl-tRNA synthetase [Encephalitozoon intestinalis ATCC 50506]ADM11977.1 cysteinyl-tRNA synthetase [Encephalitozoon intestinalis ATCC 50506]UTX45762.1 cysteinyl-tRNA synthetase [Encephalitozoon intestinalis]